MGVILCSAIPMLACAQIMDEIREQTIAQICAELKVSPNTVRMGFPAMGLTGFARNRAATEEERAAILARYGSKATTRKGPGTKRDNILSPIPAGLRPVPPGKTPPHPAEMPWFMAWPPIVITGVSIALTITGLWVFASWAGVGAGLMFAMFLITAVMVARNRMKGATSEQALRDVLYLELGAAVLHCFTFWRLLPEFPAGDWFFAARVAGCITLAGFVARLSYSAVLTVRNYNAEV